MNLKTWQIIKEPIMTEKTHKMSLVNLYVFMTDYHANKIEIKEAFEFLFSVKVKYVHTKIVHRKARQVGRFSGYIKRKKISYIKLDPEYSLDIFKQSRSIQKKESTAEKSKIEKIKQALFDVSNKGKPTDDTNLTKKDYLKKVFNLLKKKKQSDLDISAERGKKIKESASKKDILQSATKKINKKK